MIMEDPIADAALSSEDDEEEEIAEEETGVEGIEEDAGEIDSDDEEEEETEKRAPYNDQVGLQSKLNEIKLNLDWVETLDVTVDTTNLKVQNGNETISKETDGKDDFRREMLFYCQAQEAAREALNKLQVLSIPTQRPDDYFAEMVKSDVHMQKVRKKLLEKKDGMEASEKAKRQRELKKIGKKVQQNVLQKRQAEKKKMLQEVDRMKKGKSDKLYGDGGDPFEVSADKNKKSGIGAKRKRKDEKFGFGGRKRKFKKNSAESASEMTSFKSHVHGKSPGIPGRGGRKGRGGGPGGRGKPPAKNINHNKAKKRGKR